MPAYYVIDIVSKILIAADYLTATTFCLKTIFVYRVTMQYV